MTACVDNKEKKGGAAKAVSATLAGVLAVGMVPAVAFATPEDGTEAEADGEISLLAEMTNAEAFQRGAISDYKDGAGIDADYVAGTKTGPVPTYVQPYGTGVSKVAVEKFYVPGAALEADMVYYGYIQLENGTGVQVGETYKNADGEAITGYWAKDLSNPGDYAVAVFKTNAEGTGVETNVTVADEFTVEAASLKDAVITLGTADATNIVFNGGMYDFDSSAAGTDLKVFLNGQDITALVDAKIVNTSDRLDVTPVEVGGIEMLPAGDYLVLLDGKTGTYLADTTAYVNLKISAFDISAAKIVLNNQASGLNNEDYTTTIESINDLPAVATAGEATSPIAPLLQLTDYTPDPEREGDYTVTVGPKAGLPTAIANSFVNPSQETYSVVESVLVPNSFYFRYDGNGATTYNGNPLKIDYSAKEFSAAPGTTSNSFDASKLKVLLTDGTKEFKSDEYNLVVTNTDTFEVGGIDMLKNSGNYSIVAVLNAKALDYEYAGRTNAISVVVTQGDVEDADVTFAYKGEVVKDNEPDITYDGTDHFGDFTVTVKTSQDAPVDAADYTVSIEKKNVDGDYVAADGVIGAGDYQLVVTSDKYDLNVDGGKTAETLQFTVKQLQPADFRIAGLLKIDPSSWNSTKPADSFRGEFLPYTGAEIVPVVEYAVADDQGDYVWNVLPADQYKITGITYNRDINAATTDTFVKVDAVQAVGTYKFTWDNGYENGNAALGQNFKLTGISGDIEKLVVSDAEYFLDCPTGEWYYDEVLTAANNGWIKGFNNSVFYQPHESIKRGDVCVILARMAGVTLSIDENGGVADKYYETPFSDVDGNLYYAEAIAWAANTGVVTGYDGTTEFCPEEPITREAFATMLSRYAANMGIDITGAAGAADEYADAGAVSWWAEGAVDWAVSADIMGVDTSVLAPTANISRAETAAMVVRL